MRKHTHKHHNHLLPYLFSFYKIRKDSLLQVFRILDFYKTRKPKTLYKHYTQSFKHLSNDTYN
ncbi:hypothetical protein X975_15612, partial [Stegodyphus mimosarum]